MYCATQGWCCTLHMQSVRLPGRQKLEIQIDCNDQVNICSSLFFIRNLFVMKEDWICRKSIFALLLFARGRETISRACKYMREPKDRTEGREFVLFSRMHPKYSWEEYNDRQLGTVRSRPTSLVCEQIQFVCKEMQRSDKNISRCRPAGCRLTFYCATSPLSRAGSTLKPNLPFICHLNQSFLQTVKNILLGFWLSFPIRFTFWAQTETLC